MLVAHTKDEQLVSLLDFNRDHINHLKKNDQRFYCPACQGEVIPKLGEKQIWHFAHKRNQRCDIEIEPESPYHINGKRQLYEWLLSQGIDVKLEHFLKDIRQKPDVFVNINGIQYAIEYQCSTISEQLFFKRTNTYISNGYEPIWILGANQFKRNSPHFFQLNQFSWLFSRKTSDHELPHLLVYCSKQVCMIELSNLIPLSALRSIGQIRISPLQHISFPFKIDDQPNKLPIQLWSQIKAQWRKFKVKSRLSKSEKFFYHFYYHKQKNPLLFPSEAGIPVKNLEIIQTPPYIWQAWLLENHVSSREIGDKIPFQLISRSFESLVKQKVFKLRSMPLVNCSPDKTIMNYLNVLCEFEILKRVDAHLFVKNNQVPTATTFDEVLTNDKRIMEHYKKIFRFQ